MAIGKQGRLPDGAIGVALESQQVVAVASSMRCIMEVACDVSWTPNLLRQFFLDVKQLTADVLRDRALAETLSISFVMRRREDLLRIPETC